MTSRRRRAVGHGVLLSALLLVLAAAWPPVAAHADWDEKVTAIMYGEYRIINDLNGERGSWTDAVGEDAWIQIWPAESIEIRGVGSWCITAIDEDEVTKKGQIGHCQT